MAKNLAILAVFAELSAMLAKRLCSQHGNYKDCVTKLS